MKAKTPKQVLTAVEWMLENVGWTQGSFVKLGTKGETLGFCLSGALERVEVHPQVREQARLLLLETLEKLSFRDRPTYIVGFNDHPSTKKEDVIKVIKTAMRKAKK